jgi:hypothetical protein
MRRTALLLCLVLMAGTACATTKYLLAYKPAAAPSGNTYYLDGTAGSDAAAGTAWGTAWKTISKVTSGSTSADTVHVRNWTRDFEFYRWPDRQYWASDVNQYNVHWSFNAEYRIGQFCNKDFWVSNGASAVVINTIAPASLNTAGVITNGSMIDYDVTDYVTAQPGQTKQGFDNRMPDAHATEFTAALNVARPGGNTLSAENQLSITPTKSLISAISGTGTIGSGWNKDWINHVGVLTILASAADYGDFRPPFCKTTAAKAVLWNESDVNWSTLKDDYALQGVGIYGAPQKLTKAWGDRVNVNLYYDFTPGDDISYERFLERTWATFGTGSDGQETWPCQDCPAGYDQRIGIIGEVMLELNSDANTLAQKKPCALYVIQHGIDAWWNVQRNYNSTQWTVSGFGVGNTGGQIPGEGHAEIVFAGIMLNDDAGMLTASTLGNYWHETGSTVNIQASDIYTAPYALRSPGAGNYTTGLVSVHNGSNRVEFTSGHEGTWAGLGAGGWLMFGAAGDDQAMSTSGVGYTISSYDVNNIGLTLSTNYTGVSADHKAYMVSSFVGYGHIGTNNNGTGEYTSTWLNYPEWIPFYSTNPEYGVTEWTASYRQGNYCRWAGVALALMMMDGGKTAWGHDVWFDYMDRAYTALDEPTYAWQNPRWVGHMYHDYRTTVGFPAVWAP